MQFKVWLFQRSGGQQQLGKGPVIYRVVVPEEHDYGEVQPTLDGSEELADVSRNDKRTTTMSKQCLRVMSAAITAVGLLMAGRATAGSLDPTNAPGPTMHTLEEIYQKQVGTDQKVSAFVSPQMLSSTTTVVSAGYYAATNLTQADEDLAAGNIKTNVTIFGVVGTLSTNVGGSTYTAALAKTGQTTSYQTGDDGDYEKGVAWPNPRFTVQADTNCVLDNLTGLIWARNANMGGPMTWSNAIFYCEALNYGGQTDWRLPNAKELYSLIDLGRDTPALPTGHPFAGVQSDYYWSSSTYAGSSVYAWFVHLYDGRVGYGLKTSTAYVWPVRGGQ